MTVMPFAWYEKTDMPAGAAVSGSGTTQSNRRGVRHPPKVAKSQRLVGQRCSDDLLRIRGAAWRTLRVEIRGTGQIVVGRINQYEFGFPSLRLETK